LVGKELWEIGVLKKILLLLKRLLLNYKTKNTFDLKICHWKKKRGNSIDEFVYATSRFGS
jgi:hypothetical protein